MAKIHIPTPVIDTTPVVAWSSEPSEEELENHELDMREISRFKGQDD